MSDPAPSGNGVSDSLLTGLLAECVRLDASDLHLSCGRPPMVRVHGRLDVAANQPALGEPQMQLIAAELLRSAVEDWSKGSIDGACTGPGGVRFRFNLYRRGGLLAAAIRRLEDRFRSLQELGMPTVLYALGDLRDGLVIISGPTGAGKSTTLATILDRINTTRPCHIITIEDPVEYIHKPAMSLVHQRQVGLDAPSFNDALVASLRQDPDVILVGEIRDLETIRTAITAAETGHLVFTTVHAGDCAGTVERLTAVFPEGEQDSVRRQLAMVLRAVVAQHLLPGVRVGEHCPRVAASEVLMVTPAVANLVAAGKSAQIYSAMESGQSLGMQTLEQDVARLWMAGKITEQTAVSAVNNVTVLRERAAMLKRKASGTGTAREVSRA
jgi:twitching motility protein PilT